MPVATLPKIPKTKVACIGCGSPTYSLYCGTCAPSSVDRFACDEVASVGTIDGVKSRSGQSHNGFPIPKSCTPSARR